MAKIMPRIIKALQVKGLKLVTISELLAAAKPPYSAEAQIIRREGRQPRRGCPTPEFYLPT